MKKEEKQSVCYTQPIYKKEQSSEKKREVEHMLHLAHYKIGLNAKT